MGKKTLILFVAFFIELVTLFFRYGLKMESTRDTKNWISPLTGGMRIHHGYIGVLLLLLSAAVLKKSRARFYIEVIAYSLVFSDILHHFFVLWPVEGTPEFDLTY